MYKFSIIHNCLQYLQAYILQRAFDLPKPKAAPPRAPSPATAMNTNVFHNYSEIGSSFHPRRVAMLNVVHIYDPLAYKCLKSTMIQVLLPAEICFLSPVYRYKLAAKTISLLIFVMPTKR